MSVPGTKPECSSPEQNVVDGRGLTQGDRRHSSLAGNGDLLDVAMIRPTTAPQHIDPRVVTPQVCVLASQLQGISGVEIGRLIEFGVAAPRGVCTNATDAFDPLTFAGERAVEVRRVCAVYHVVCGAASSLRIDFLDGLVQRLSGRQASVSFYRECDCHWHGHGAGRPSDAYGLVGVSHGDRRHHVSLGLREDANLCGMVGLGLVCAWYGMGNIAVTARTDATADYHRYVGFGKLLAQLTHQVDGLGVSGRQRSRRISELLAPVCAGAPCRALENETSAV